MSNAPPVIVGAGPAGLAAAITLVEHGLHPTIIDEGQAPGGQIHRPQAVDTPSTRRGDTPILQRFEAVAQHVEFIDQAAVWGIFERRLAISRAGASFEQDARHLLIASGAYEFCPPFPGWTLPGVMTPGSAQSMVKNFGVRPGRRAVVAGSGPFLLVVAEQLARAGVEVLAVAEAASSRAVLGSATQLLGTPRLLFQGARLLAAMRTLGIPVLRGHVIARAEGDEELHEVELAPCDADWNVVPGRTRRFQADVLAVGYGFVPRIQLAQLLGCELTFREELGGWIPSVDETLETGVPGVWVAGESAGVAGALVAEHEGRLAGLAMARRLGALDELGFARSAQTGAQGPARVGTCPPGPG